MSVCVSNTVAFAIFGRKGGGVGCIVQSVRALRVKVRAAFHNTFDT